MQTFSLSKTRDEGKARQLLLERQQKAIYDVVNIYLLKISGGGGMRLTGWGGVGVGGAFPHLKSLSLCRLKRQSSGSSRLSIKPPKKTSSHCG